MPLNQDELMAAMSSLNDTRADELKRAMEKVQQNPQSADDLMQLQIAMQKWSLANEMQARMIKELNDSLKGIIDKMG
ncbi:MAG TPA: EscF/YscF/HrpA family type III secretion system needle major subunit [Rhizomicrobium sp.]|jgi:type III secretion apparatus needle protein|nr:EscF/YscF/HrpA family type III secretion system needle major subunit [Rhizomicrobium sp.]